MAIFNGFNWGDGTHWGSGKHYTNTSLVRYQYVTDMDTSYLNGPAWTIKDANGNVWQASSDTSGNITMTVTAGAIVDGANVQDYPVDGNGWVPTIDTSGNITLTYNTPKTSTVAAIANDGTLDWSQQVQNPTAATPLVLNTPQQSWLERFTHRVSVKLTCAPGYFNIFQTRPILEDSDYYMAGWDSAVDVQCQRAAVRLTYTSSTDPIVLWQSRCIAEVQDQYPIG